MGKGHTDRHADSQDRQEEGRPVLRGSRQEDRINEGGETLDLLFRRILSTQRAGAEMVAAKMVAGLMLFAARQTDR